MDTTNNSIKNQELHSHTTLNKEHCSLVLYNDESHSFAFVIKTLMEICNHSLIQAEQCANIVHNKGKYDIRHGGYEKMKTLKDQLIDRGLIVTIE